ncbi:MAG TPA: hypothetical protein VNL17_14530 [Verrucomicrobiae bacterium]|nr:hypothetical protein [Verrucomicrobiae bacterium]
MKGTDFVDLTQEVIANKAVFCPRCGKNPLIIGWENTLFAVVCPDGISSIPPIVPLCQCHHNIEAAITAWNSMSLPQLCMELPAETVERHPAEVWWMK